MSTDDTADRTPLLPDPYDPSVARPVEPPPGSERAMARPLPAPPRRVLIVKPCCLGDVLMATPLAAAVRRAWPDAALDWCVDDHSAAGIRNNPHVTARLDATGTYRGAFRARAYGRLLREVRRGRYDLALVPDRSPLMAWLPKLAGVPHRVGLDSGGRGRAHTVRVPVPRGGLETELYLDLARALGLDASEPLPVVVTTEQDRATALRLLQPLGTDRPLVAMHPAGGVNPGMVLAEKRWPPDRFARLADRFIEQRHARVVILGGPDDVPLAEWVGDAVAEQSRAYVHRFAGRLSLTESAAVVERCDMYVGNDSGMAHMAVGVGTPVVVVFGPTDPRVYGPIPGAGVAVAPPAGAVDRLEDARGSALIETVQVEAVWSAAQQLWARAHAPA